MLENNPKAEEEIKVPSRRSGLTPCDIARMDGYCLESVGLGVIVDSENDSDSWHQVSAKAEPPQDEQISNPCSSIDDLFVAKHNSSNLDVNLLDPPLRLFHINSQREQLASEGQIEPRERGSKLLLGVCESKADICIEEEEEIDLPANGYVAVVDPQNNIALQDIEEEQHFQDPMDSDEEAIDLLMIDAHDNPN